ncbi:hypothetical protein ABFS83_03G004500 [Erythranthe nasuta]
MEGQQQLRREDYQEKEERETKMQQLPLESSPYLKHTDLGEYNLMGHGAVEWQLSPKGGGATTIFTSVDGNRSSPKQADAVDRKLK